MHNIEIRYGVPVPMRDGTVLRADVYCPAGAGPWPVVVVRTPYGKNAPEDLVYTDPVAGAKRGMIVVVQDVRSRFESEGDDWVPGVAEAQDGVDTIAWAAEMPASNGRVAMWGRSYLGHVQWLAAAEQPPALRAIAPHITV